MTSKWQKLTAGFATLLILFIPLQFFFSEFLQAETNFSGSLIFWLTHWYEPVAGLMLLGVLWRLWQKKYQLDLTSKFLVGLFIFALFAVTIHPSAVGRSLEGFRFSLFALMIFSLFCLTSFDKITKDKLINLYRSLSIGISLWAILERYLPINYWERLGVLQPGTDFGWGKAWIVEVYQSASIIGAPNQLASYLLPAFFLTLSYLPVPKIKRSELLRLIIEIAVIASAILLTFSRSALIGLAFALFIWIALYIKNWFHKLVMAITIAFFVTVGFLVFAASSSNPFDFITHGASQVGHESALQVSLTELQSRIGQPLLLIFGSGLGTAGPLVLKYGRGIISESWYFQILFEIGVVGLILWLWLVFHLVKRNLGSRAESNWQARGLAFSLISTSVVALFLHTFADNPALSITLFTLLGVGYNDFGSKHPIQSNKTLKS